MLTIRKSLIISKRFIFLPLFCGVVSVNYLSLPAVSEKASTTYVKLNKTMPSVFGFTYENRK
jgi:hypothetical protein